MKLLRLGLIALSFAMLGMLAPVARADGLIDFSPELLERVEAKWGASAVKRLQAMRNIVLENQAMSELEKLELVNNFFNLVPYYSDLEHWGVED